ncbi:MAG: hypothetical protein M0P55_14530, partial [Clostridiales bacterium]|nr:hypothetical protein [Clostridiales bacterium]
SRQEWVKTFRQDMADQDRLAVIQASQKPTKLENREQFSMQIDRVFRPYQWRLERLPEAEGGPAIGAIGDYLYRGSPIEAFEARINHEVVAPSEAVGITRTDRGEFLFQKRVGYEWRDSTGGRMNLANPGLATPKSARERLAEMRRTLGPERYKALESAWSAMENIWQTDVVDLARKLEITDDNLQKFLEDNKVYATFAAVRGSWNATEDALQQALNNKLGSGVGSKIYKQIGMTGPIMNPESAMTLKGAALINWMYKERAKWVAVQALLNSEWNDLFRPAEKRWTGRRQEFIERDDSRVGTLFVVHKGETYAWYAPRFFVDQWNRENSIQTHTVPAAIYFLNGLIKQLLTAKSPFFWFITNAPRDVRTFNTLMPGTSKRWREYVPGTMGAFGEFALSSFRAAHAHFAGRESPLAMQALKRGMAISRAEGYWGEHTEADPFIRELQRRGLNPADPAAEGDILKAMFEFLKHQSEYGQVLERTLKIAGMQYMDKYKPDMPEWRKAETVRSLAGSPDFLNKPLFNPAINTVALFYNAIKEGVRSSWRTMRERPAEFAWNTARRVVLPAVLQALIYGGLAAVLTGRKRRTDEEEQFLSIPEQDKLNYLCIPVGWTDRKERKVLYARIVMSEPERIIHAITSAALRLAVGERTGAGGIAADLGTFMGGQLPGINPLLRLIYDMRTLAAGGNPILRGRPMLTQDEAKTRGAEAVAKVAKTEFNSVLGGLAGRLDTTGEPATSGIEAFLRLPVVSASLGRVLKVSNAGYKQHLQDAAEAAATREARDRIEIDGIIRTYRRTGRMDHLTPAQRAKLAQGAYILQAAPTAPLLPELALQRHYASYFKSALERATLERVAPLEVRTILNAPSGAQRSSQIQAVIQDQR